MSETDPEPRVFAKLDANDLRRIAMHLPDGSDLALLVLKGHLLVEERLREMLKRQARDQESIDKARLPFRTLALLAKALYFQPDDGALWDAVLLLNQIRNNLAHELETPGQPDGLAELHAIGRREFVLDWTAAPTPHEELRTTIMVILARLRGIRDERGRA